MRYHFKAARKAKGWSQSDLAEAMGVSRTIVSDWEQGRSSPSMCRLELLSKSLDVSITHLVTGKPDESSIKIGQPPFEWEDVSDSTHRARIFGGWLVREVDPTAGVALVFVPDSRHGWELT